MYLGRFTAKPHYLSNKGLPSLIIILPAIFAASCGKPTEFQLLCITSEFCGIPVHVILITTAPLQPSGAVDDRDHQLSAVCQAPTAGLPSLYHPRVPAPVVRGEPLEDDANVYTSPWHGHHTQQGKDSLLAMAKLPSFFQDIIKAGHGC